MSGTLAIPVSDRDHMRGDADAPVTLVEYGDYQCPACGMAYPYVEQLLERYGRHVRFVFRNFPLSEAHPMATMAARVAEGAGTLGKFWQMHDWLYEHQSQWSLSGAPGIAEGVDAVGLDPAMLERALESPAIAERVRHDFMGGVRSGVNGTPGFFVNGQLYRDDFDTLGDAIGKLLASR